MSTNRRHVKAGPERVFAALVDGWNYASWVVGATHIRDVDAGWPAPGSRIHHSVGSWPLVIRDTTSVEELEPGARLVLRARAWPMGEARVTFTVEPDGVGTLVTIHEKPLPGPARLAGPVGEGLLYLRNVETLARLAARVENARYPTGPDAPGASR